MSWRSDGGCCHSRARADSPTHSGLTGIGYEALRVDIYQGVCRRVAGMCWWPQFMVTSSPITKWLAYCHVQPEKKYLCGAFQTNTRDRRFNQSNIYSQSNNNWFGSERAVIHKHNHKTRPSRFNTMLGSLVSIIKQLDKNEVYSHSGNTLLEVSRI